MDFVQEPPPPSVGGRLLENKERILALWEARVRQTVPPAEPIGSPALLNSLPDLLERLAVALSSRSPEQALEQDRRAAMEHGEQRAKLEEYSLDQVICEYQVLRTVLLNVLERDEPLPATSREMIFDVILAAVRHAAGEFARLRERETKEAESALRRANQSLDRRVKVRIAELRASEERFRHLVDAVKDYAIFSVDPEGYINSWNSGCVRMKGYSVEEAVGKHFSMLYPAEGKRRDEPMAHLRSAAIEGRFRGEGLRVRKNGDLFLADVSITPIHEDDTITGFTKVVADLTERNVLIQERDLSRSDTARMGIEAEYRERFVATLTHDLRTPLSAAKELIARSPDNAEKVRVRAHRISDSVDRTDRMIGDLLDASQLHAGKTMHLEFGQCDLRQIAAEVCDELATRHGNRFVVEAEGSTTGSWSAEGLRRVLENLLSNAVKYGDPGTAITVRLRHTDGHVLVSVHNQGTIIPAEEQVRLFEPFHRTHMAITGGRSGWGLGLTLVRGIVEGHRGVVKVASFPKEGTTFTVDLPVDPQSERPN